MGADPVSPLDITDELSKSNSLQRDCMRLGRGGGDLPSDGNTPERGGGDQISTPQRGEEETLHQMGKPCREDAQQST
jgi:hypothetical protein